jgi:hypothetical protein
VPERVVDQLEAGFIGTSAPNTSRYDLRRSGSPAFQPVRYRGRLLAVVSSSSRSARASSDSAPVLPRMTSSRPWEQRAVYSPTGQST